MAEVLPPQDPWRATIANAEPGIVSIDTSKTSKFDVHRTGDSCATGFVISTKYGLMLTSRHVIGEEPTDAYAIFGKGAIKCPITPCEIDPIHNSAICKYDVTDLGDFETKQIEIRPELAKVDLKVRVIDNDTGEVFSILPSVINKLNHNPMHWDARRYTFIVTFGPIS